MRQPHNMEIRDPPVQPHSTWCIISPGSGGYSQPPFTELGTPPGSLSPPGGKLRFAGTWIRKKHPGDPQLRGIMGSTHLQPTLFEGSSFNAAFRMGMASLYSPC